MQTISDETGLRAPRRKHSAQFKFQVVAACMRPGASTAAVAKAHDVNANMVRRWIVQARSCGDTGPSAAPAATASPAFIAVHQRPAKAASTDIRLKLRQGATTLSVRWPSADAVQCAAWVREVLR